MSDLLKEKLDLIFAVSSGGIAEDDLAERLQWCATHGQEHAHVFPGEHGLVMWWGGRELAGFDEGLLSDDVPLDELRAAFVPDAPDDPSELG